MSRISPYYDEFGMADAVAAGEHRGAISGLWQELGLLQLDLLRGYGLQPEHTVLDLGCGCLRGGAHLVRYLDPGNYFGVDLLQSLLDAGYEKELALEGLQTRLPRENLLASATLDFEVFGVSFDYLLAMSVFTHLPMNHVRGCLEKATAAMRPGAQFIATYFRAPAEAPTFAATKQPGADIITYAGRDTYHMRANDLDHLAQGLDLSVRHIGPYGHPRGQELVIFTKS